MHYFDASALAKRYVREKGSQTVRRLLGVGSAATSRLSEVEVASAIARRAREGVLSAEQRNRVLTALSDDVRALTVVEFTAEIAAEARVLGAEARAQGRRFDSAGQCSVSAASAWPAYHVRRVRRAARGGGSGRGPPGAGRWRGIHRACSATPTLLINQEGRGSWGSVMTGRVMAASPRQVGAVPGGPAATTLRGLDCAPRPMPASGVLRHPCPRRKAGEQAAHPPSGPRSRSELPTAFPERITDSPYHGLGVRRAGISAGTLASRSDAIR